MAKPGMKKGGAKRVQENPIAYVIQDKVFGELKIKNSANAWFLERAKVELLIAACKFDASVEECCAYAGISIDQYKYFMEKHPDFSTVKALCNKLPDLKARKTIVDDLDDPETAKWYLPRKRKGEFGERKEVTGPDGEPLFGKMTPDEKKEVDEAIKNL